MIRAQFAWRLLACTHSPPLAAWCACWFACLSCVAALALAGPAALLEVDSGLAGWWLAERQLPTGGLNGRPEKKQDVCYSWWVLSSLAILGHVDWIDSAALGAFILDCQDPKAGGISDRPGNMADVFHTYFGIAGLALLGYPDLNQIDPVYALPTRVVNKLALPNRYVASVAATTAAATANTTPPAATAAAATATTAPAS